MKTQNLKKYLPLVALGIFAGSLMFALVRFGMQNSRSRYIFYFNSYDSDELCLEMRYLNRESIQGKTRLFVDELLLGPMTNRFKNLFPSGTQVEFCIEKGKELHLGLSQDALRVTPETADIKNNISLLKYNIVKNFTNINKIFIYIGGKSVDL